MLYVSFLRAVPGGYRCVQHCVNCIGNGLNIIVIDLYVKVLHFCFKSTSAVSKKECTCWNTRKNNRVRFLLAGRPRPSQHFTSASTSTGISKMPAKLTLFNKNTLFLPDVLLILSWIRCVSSVLGGWGWEREDVSVSLLCGLSAPLDVGDLHYGPQQLESILDVRRTVGCL